MHSGSVRMLPYKYSNLLFHKYFIPIKKNGEKKVEYSKFDKVFVLLFYLNYFYGIYMFKGSFWTCNILIITTLERLGKQKVVGK